LGQAPFNLSDQKDENSSLKEIKPLLVQQTGGLESLETQRVIDTNHLNQATSDLNYHKCKAEKFDEARLKKVTFRKQLRNSIFKLISPIM